MLIETNENKNFGTIIYSENKFDFLTNFTKVDKREPDIREHIDFKEVSEFISQPVEKNLILYRLITNDENLDPFSSKLGYFIKVEDRIEVVFFDPVFIVKDIENLKLTIPRKDFRFKIQQVGYRTKFVKDESSIYEERFAINMSEIEAENQNDAVFAETMLKINGRIIKKKKRKEIESIKNKLGKVSSSSVSKNNDKFYHLDGNESKKNSTFIGKVRRTNSGEGDFFSRVNAKKSDKKNENNNTLKMFK